MSAQIRSQFYDKELSLLRFDDPAGGKEPINMELLLSKLSSSTDAKLRARIALPQRGSQGV